MDIIFERFEKGVTKKSGAGKNYKVNIVHGKKIFKGQESPYSRDYFTNGPVSAELDMVFESARPGASIRLTFNTDQFKSLKSAEIIGGPSAAEDTPTPDKAPAEHPKGVVTSGSFRDPAEIIRTDALDKALKTVALAFENPEAFSKLLKKTATMSVLKMEILDLAKDYERFINGKMVLSDPSSNPEDMGDPKEFEDEDIPV